ncbi:hypothetical protein LCM10_02220 [Rossellomorea aquimaris]|uniref:hypothetical protein n=1 Tax=Rossellomorea aquimaris TaxID=189382 RepID=UPI001CD1FE82|nr:hypothetical protein [Rossellomorea aquimaris]MCA1053787.1 hypothetical protein [Rossellomorea aquimaris]
MLWFILIMAILVGVVNSVLRRRTSSFQDPTANERQIQEEERIKASSWFGGGQ